MKRSRSKLFIFIFLFCASFFTYLYVFLKPYDYEKKYQINKYNITESYNKSNNMYKFIVEFDGKKIPFIINHSYIKKRNLIDDILEHKNDDKICLELKNEHLNIYPLCFDDDNIYATSLTGNSNNDLFNNEYKEIKINSLNNNSYLLFNYHGFYLINKDKQDDIVLFSNDLYHLDLIYQKDKYLLIPNYNSNHYFNNFYLIDVTNGKVKEIKSDYDIYFDGYFLGDYKNYIIYVDKKEKKEYFIDIKKGIIKQSKYIKIVNNKLVNCLYEELEIINENNLFNYIIEDGFLFLNVDDIKIKVSDKMVDRIIKIINNEVYYLSNDTLYLNNLFEEIALLKNFEWNFNKTNMIYLYK